MPTVHSRLSLSVTGAALEFPIDCLSICSGPGSGAAVRRSVKHVTQPYCGCTLGALDQFSQEDWESWRHTFQWPEDRFLMLKELHPLFPRFPTATGPRCSDTGCQTTVPATTWTNHGGRDPQALPPG
jgi:hypothetical protein